MLNRLGLALMLALPLGGCGGASDALRVFRGAAAQTHDPCTVLSGGESQPYVGALATPPYRASDGAADAAGDECVYRGKDGRQLTLRPSWEGGELMGRVLQGVPSAFGGVLGKGAPGLDSLTHMVMKQDAGPWDRATWIPGGSLFASKGQHQVVIDVSAASGRETDALALTRIVMPRFEHPLAYDGARAVALVPKPRARPNHACDLLPAAAVQAAIGPLDGGASSDAPETSCTWRVRTAQGERSYPVEIVWQGGRKNYQMLVHGMMAVGGMLGAPSGSPLDSLTPPPQMQAVVGGLMEMVSGSAEGGGAGSANGAAAMIGFRTDTGLAGPWDHAALLHGTQLLAVRGDVFVGMSLMSADYEKAKALMRAICERL